MEEFLRSGRLQTSFATMLRARLGLRSVAFGDAGEQHLTPAMA
jgi:hypothetical protein